MNVAVKAADFLSAYGEDYDILIDGQPMTAVDGDVIDPSRFTYVADSDPTLPTEAETAPEAESPAEPEAVPSALHRAVYPPIPALRALEVPIGLACAQSAHLLSFARLTAALRRCRRVTGITLSPPAAVWELF